MNTESPDKEQRCQHNLPIDVDCVECVDQAEFEEALAAKSAGEEV